MSGAPAPESLYRSPNALAGYYSRFRVSERLLLTGHSHQAWPDCGFEGQVEAWNDAALYVDEKWERAFAKAERVRRGFARLLEDGSGDIALGASTHELVVRFLSALPLRDRRKLVTTDAEFHTLRRQLARLEEEGIQVVRVSHRPAGEVAGRLIEALDERTAAVLVSSVFYHNGHIVPHLGEVMAACAKVGAELLVDAYHALNAVPFSLKQEGLEGAFVVGGGYKYCQLGEGNCFLRIPPGCRMRPVITGWFAEFEQLEAADSSGRVSYPPGPARFAGATYDPTSHYRAARVFDFFEERGLTPEFLREVSRHQVGLLAVQFDALDLDPAVVRRDRSIPLEALAGFLALESSRAPELVRELRKRGVMVDARGSLLRFGPAPYLCDDQLRDAMAALKEVTARF
ncbi:Kynureninase [bacterium HR33]|nr:Kynureninase [bacterium HR33]